MDDEAETYKLWRIRKTIMQASPVISSLHSFISKFDSLTIGSPNLGELLCLSIKQISMSNIIIIN